MANKRKQKGKYLENLVSKLIQEHWNLSDIEVHRNQTSGIFQTEFGDIYFKDLDIVIECKNQESWDYKHILTWSKPITDWWNQLLKDVEGFQKKLNRTPLYFLVVGKNRYPKFAIFDIVNLYEAISNFNLDIFSNHLDFYSIINQQDRPKLVAELNQSLKALSLWYGREENRNG
jgi:hypothetical protein